MLFGMREYADVGFPGGTSGKNPLCQFRRYEMWIWSLGWEEPLEEGMATHSSIFAWRIPWTEEHDRPQSIGHKELGKKISTRTSKGFMVL